MEAHYLFFVFVIFCMLIILKKFYTILSCVQIKAFVTQLEENQRQMNDALAICQTAIDNNDPTHASYYSLKIEPEFRDAKKALEVKPVSAFRFVWIYRR